MNGPEHPLWEAVDRIRERQPRYQREAYGFLMLALARTVEAMPATRRNDPERRHLSGQELLHGVIGAAHREFGMMAATVFREWGVCAASDVGEMVFQLVAAGQLSARPEDRREDFEGGPDLLDALEAPWRPRSAPGGGA
jgi:uncharacterized repeat protein (TIGR04138 family)